MHTVLLLYSVSAYSVTSLLCICIQYLHMCNNTPYIFFFFNFFFLLHTYIQYLHVHKHSISTYSIYFLLHICIQNLHICIDTPHLFFLFLTSFFLYSIPAYSIYICVKTPYMHEYPLLDAQYFLCICTVFSSLLHIRIHYLHMYRHSLLNIWVQYLHI